MKPIVICIAVCGALLAFSASAQPTSPLRGMELYENHCTHCHESRAHIREKRKARSLAQIESWIWRWAKELKLSWTNEEVKEVLSYLNTRYYRY